MSDNIQGQEQKVFHPKLVKATKLQAQMCEVEGKARRPTEAEAEAVIDPQIAVLHELQTGALSVDDDKAKSAQVLRHLYLDRFHKRDYIQGPGGNLDTLLDAQTELDKAKAQNKRRQERRERSSSPTPDGSARPLSLAASSRSPPCRSWTPLSWT